MQKLAIGFGIGALLIACTWAARAALDSNGKPSAPAAPTAQETNAEPALPEEELPAEKMGLVEETTSPVQVLVSLLIVVAVMVTLLWGLSRLMRRARLTPSRDRVLDLVGLTDRARQLVVQFAGRDLDRLVVREPFERVV